MITFEPQIVKNLEKCIFKYGDTAHLEDTLIGNTLKASRLSDFNDIYETEYKFVHYFKSIDDQKRIMIPSADLFKNIREKADAYLENIRLACFSNFYTNNLMWSHYAANHSGICYCFDFSAEKPFIVDGVNWGTINYSTSVPKVKIFQGKTTEGMLFELMSDVILTKNLDWSYEKEIRFYKTQEEDIFSIRIESLKAIVIGRRTPDSEINKIKDIVATIKKEKDHIIEIYYAYRLPNIYNLGLTTYKNLRDNSEKGSFSADIPVLNEIESEIITE